MNTDQGSQFTSREFTQIRLSEDPGMYQQHFRRASSWWSEDFLAYVKARRELGAYFQTHRRPHQRWANAGGGLLAGRLL